MNQQGILRRIYNQVPNLMKVRAGEHAYESYMKLRRSLLDAHVGCIEGKRRITYFHIDRGHPETLVFLHGFADSKDTFYDAAHFLCDRYNIICPDLPGFGKSDKRKDDIYSLDNYAEWIEDFLLNIGIERFHLAGNSLGGAIAAAVTLKIPEKITSLTLVDAAGIYCDGKHSLHHELFDGNIIFDVRNEREFEYFLDRVFFRRPLLPYPVKDFIYKEFHRHSVWHRKVVSDLFEGLSSEDDPRFWEIAINNRLKKIKVPSLILWGDEDTLFPPETAYLIKNELMPHAQLHFFTDVGHCPQMEVPRRFARVIKKFLNEESRKLEQQILHDQGRYSKKPDKAKIVSPAPQSESPSPKRPRSKAGKSKKMVTMAGESNGSSC